MMALILVFQAVTFTIHKCQGDETSQSKSQEHDSSGFADYYSRSSFSGNGTPGEIKRHSRAGSGTLSGRKKYTLFPFNPNTITPDSLQLLGFSKKQALTIIHYREKGGRFRRKEDFSKMYTVSREKYLELEPYIIIPKTEEEAPTAASVSFRRYNTEKKPAASSTSATSAASASSAAPAAPSTSTTSATSSTASSAAATSAASKLLHTSENSVAENSSSATYSSDPSPGGSSNGGWKTPRPKVYIDLNEADSAALLSVRGIGPYFCKAILSYRKSLGSFANIDQLLEIKGMDQEKFDRIKDQVFVHPGGILKFSIAEASRAFLERHPYIGSYNARGIALFLETHSKEECTLKALVENRILSPEDTLRLHPYIR